MPHIVKTKGPSTHDTEFANEYSTKTFSSSKMFLKEYKICEIQLTRQKFNKKWSFAKNEIKIYKFFVDEYFWTIFSTALDF